MDSWPVAKSASICRASFATGLLELDDQCRTQRFTLDFTPQAVKLFEDRWQRLLPFAVSFRELLDRAAKGK